MPDLAVRADRPYSLVTTLVHRGPGTCKLAQIDLHLTSGDIRLRFLDRRSLAHFCNTIADLASDRYLPDRDDGASIRTRLYTERDETAGTRAEQVPIEGLFGPRF